MYYPTPGLKESWLRGPAVEEEPDTMEAVRPGMVMWILTGADISVPVSVFVFGKLGHSTREVAGFMSDILQKKDRVLSWNFWHQEFIQTFNEHRLRARHWGRPSAETDIKGSQAVWEMQGDNSEACTRSWEKNRKGTTRGWGSRKQHGAGS